MNNKSIVYRALVTYSNERTGEIKVKIPALIGASSEVSITYIGRSSTNGVWTVPSPGEQIVVSSDDENLTNVFWVHTDVWSHSEHQRNYIQVHDTTDQTQSAGGIAAVTFNTVDISSGIRLVDNSKITFDYAGVYNLQYSVQWVNTDTQIHDTAVWLNYQGTAYPDSATYMAVPSSHGGVPGTAVTAINILGKAVGTGDYVQLMWSTSSSQTLMATLSGTDVGLPSSIPASPAVILTVTQVA